MWEDVRSIVGRSRREWHWGMAGLLLAGLLCIGAMQGAKLTGLPIAVLLDDPNFTAKQPFFYGAFELASGLLMAATAGVLLFSALFAVPDTRGFLFLSGVLSAVLAGDDLLQFHEQMHRLHLPETVAYVVYMGLLGAILFLRWRIVARTPAVILGGALAAYLAAGLIDGIHPVPRWLPVGAESLLELCAVSLWAAYFFRVAYLFVQEAVAGGPVSVRSPTSLRASTALPAPAGVQEAS